MVGTHEKASPAGPRLQDLQHTGQQRENGKGPILIVSQKPEISNQTNDSLQWTFSSEGEQQRGSLWGTLWHTTASVCRQRGSLWGTLTHYSFHDGRFSILLLFACMFYLGGGVARAKGDMMREDDEQDWGTWETHKESKKVIKKVLFSWIL